MRRGACPDAQQTVLLEVNLTFAANGVLPVSLRFVHTNGVWAGSAGVAAGAECGALAVGSQRLRPAEQVIAELSEQEAMRADPAAFNRVEHAQRAKLEVFGFDGRGHRGQRGAQAFGVPAKTAQPVLTSLIGRLLRQSLIESLVVNEASDLKQGDHRDAESQVRQGELRQKRDCALAEFAKITPDADGAVEIGVNVDERSFVEAMRRQRLLGLALRALVWPGQVCVGELLVILLHGTGEWV